MAHKGDLLSVRKDIRVVDATIRDGGLCNDFRFEDKFVKDLYEAKKEMYEACYYKQIMEAMEEHDFEDEEEIMDEGRRGYRGQPRSESGRFMSRGDGRRSNRGGRGRRGYESPMMYDEDWEEMQRNRDFDLSQGRMYYSGSQSSGGSSSGMSGGSMGSQGGQSSGGSSGGSRGYSDSRYENAKRGYQESKEMKDGSHMKSLEEYTRELTEDVMDMVKNMDSGEKQMLRGKMQTLASKIV